MSDSSRKTSNGAVEQIMRNMTSDLHNSDGQYIQLGFTPPSTPQEPWNMPNQLPQPPYIPSYTIPQEHPVPFPIDQFSQPQVPYNYLPQPHNYYTQETFEDLPYNYPNHTNYSDYKLFMSQKIHNLTSPDTYIQKENIITNSPSHNTIPNRSPIIDNLVGNWAPNTTGTYSPFGNPSTFNSTIFQEPTQDMECLSNNMVRTVLDEPKIDFERTEDIPNFNFNRDTKKPRMVAEVKPAIRPSYSDVLLKSAPLPNTKTKTESKETKQKKDVKKNVKNEKQKNSVTLNRSNTNNEIKDLNEKSFIKIDKNLKDFKNNNLNRKWASLDNVTDSLNDFKNELGESKKLKKNQEGAGKSTVRIQQRKVGKCENNDTDSGSGKGDSVNAGKSAVKKGTKVGNRQKAYESSYGNGERPPGKRSQRNRKRDNQVPFGIVGQKIKEYLGWWKYIVKFAFWLFHLISDVLSLSIHLSKDMGSNFYSWLIIHWAIFLDTSLTIVKRIKLFTWIYEKLRRKEKDTEKIPGFVHPGLHNNISMPTTGDEAMKRLLACKGKDPYSILGVTPVCTDGDIKNYYKKQAKLVHPDKNQQPGAEEAFKILVHAFDMIGEPERRAAYDRGVAESAQAKQAMSELTELLVQLQQKVEAAANTIRCSACGLRHKRIKIDRPSYAARNCLSCKIHHAAREGDIWAEARCFGFLWHYYACMDGGVYDITEWAGCQKDSLKHLRPDTHNVQYRIALGKQTNGPPRRHTSPRPDKNPDLDKLFNSFCGHTENTQNTRRKTKKAK